MKKKTIHRPDQWSAANDKRLIDMWFEGKSAADIANILGVSRGSVMGKVYRLRQNGVLDYRQDPSGWAGKKKKTPHPLPNPKTMASQPVQTLNLNKPKEPDPAPVVAPPVPVFDPSKPYKNILQLTYTTCRYIMTEDTSTSAFYCGEPVERRSYCKAHADLCFTRYANYTKKKPNAVSTLLLRYKTVRELSL